MATKRKSTKRATAPPPEVVSSPIDILMQMPEIAEAFTRAEIELAVDDIGYQRPAGHDISEPTHDRRCNLIRKSRVYWQGDPLAKQAVRIWTDYGVGSGISVQAEEESIQTAIDEFINQTKNRKLLSAKGQRKLSTRLLLDGELFFAIFTEDESNKTLRIIDALQITDLMTDPDDDECTYVYRRKTNDKVLYYADHALTDKELLEAAKLKDPDTKKPIKIEEDVVVYHLAYDELWKRGNGLLFCVVDWSREHRRFMEARVAITAALAKFAWKGEAKAGQATLNALRQRMESSFAQGISSPERNPPSGPGATIVRNAGFDLTPMPRVTGGSEARDDSDSLKLMVAAGTNVHLHYFGDPSTGNLATATAMELPMLKSFAAYQKLWQDAWRDLFAIVLDEAEAKERAQIDIDLPPILAEDLQKLGSFLTQISTIWPEIAVDEILQMALNALGINNIDEVIESMTEKKTELDAKAKEEQDLQITLAKTAPPRPGVPAQESEHTRLAEALEELNRPLAITEPTPPAPPLDLTVQVRMPEKRRLLTTKRGRAIRNKETGEIELTMTTEESNGTESEDE